MGIPDVFTRSMCCTNGHEGFTERRISLIISLYRESLQDHSQGQSPYTSHHIPESVVTIFARVRYRAVTSRAQIDTSVQPMILSDIENVLVVVQGQKTYE